MPFIKKNNEKQAHAPTDTRKIFIGRADKLHFFVEQILAPEEPTYNIVSISGNGGVGKSTLLARFIEEIRSPHFREYCLSAFVDEQQPTPDAAMEKLAEQLSKAGAPLGKFEKELTRFKEVAHKLQIERENAQDTAIRATVDMFGTVAEGVPAVGGLLHKGANLVTDLGLKEYRSRQSVKEALLLEDPISDLTRIFVEELNRLTETQIISSSGRSRRSQRVILFLDTFERTATALASWLLDQFLPANINTNVVLVVAGRDSIEYSLPDDPKRWLPYRDKGVISLICLDSFTEDETRAYLAARGVTGPASMNTTWQLSQGLPLYLGLLTFNVQEAVDPTEGVVANFLRWLPEQDHIKRRLAVDAALFSRPFNQDDLAAFNYLDEHGLEDTYRWLTRLPFVKFNPQEGRYRYHELAQEMFRRHLYHRSLKEYAATTRTLASYYKSLLEDTKKESGKEDYSSAEWLELLLALAYQLFFLPEATSHIEGSEQILYACKNINGEQRGEVARFLNELSHDQTNRLSKDSQNIVKQLLQFIEADMEDHAQELIEAASTLLEIASAQAAFSPELLIWLYRKRGATRTKLKDYRPALQDFDYAIALNPIFAPSYISRGLVYYYRKEYERAIQDFDQAIELDLNHGNAHNSRGAAYNELKRYKQAMQDFDQAIELNPHFVWAFNNRGITYSNLKEYQRAIQDYDRAIELDPSYLYAYANRGNAYLDLKQYQRAIQDYDRAIELDPSYPGVYISRGSAYYNLKDHQHAIQDYDCAIELDPSVARAYYLRGLSYSYSKDQDSRLAIQDFDRVIELEPGFAQAYNDRGDAYYSLKDYQLAIQDFNRASELDPEQPDFYSSRGFAYYSLKDYQLAIQDYDKAFEAGLKTAMLYSRRSLVYYELKDYQRAVQDLDCAIELEPENTHLYNFRGDAYYELKQYQRAIHDYEQTIALNSNDAHAYFGRGDAYLALKDYRRGIQEIDHAIELDPTDARFYNDRGLAYRYLKDYQQAISDYDRAIELNPGSAMAFDNRALTYYQLKDFQHAIQDLNEVIKLEPNRTDAYLLLGLVYAWLKDIEIAKVNFNRARELDPAAIYSAWMLEWLDMCIKRDDSASIERLEAIAESAPQQTTAHVCKGVALWLRGNFGDALSELEQAASPNQLSGEAYFWKAMTCASLGHDEEAFATLEKAMAVDLALPPILLTPLYWLEHDKPSFYRFFVLPLLERY